MKKILLAVAPVAATDTINDPEAIAKDVYECYKNGACMVHLHCRDPHGQLTPELGHLEKTLKLIRDMCDIIIEVSTGGVSKLTIEERVQPCFCDLVEATSLNVGSVNLGTSVYENPIEDVRYCVKTIMENHKIPETEIFELGMTYTLKQLVEQFHIPKPLLVALVFGHEGEMPATKGALKHMVDWLYENFAPEDVIWGYTEAHRQDFEMVKYALDFGAKTLRLGFEDSDFISPGVRVDTNAAIIREASEIIRAKGMMTMSPNEARKLLGIPEI
ncbi:MAG: 3-keto-5-aminohexanoate cleavage protein [Oribacterium sp.]|nr:3-keto-5-aminohexanoate cleavage protein [Oribacterium sp.]